MLFVLPKTHVTVQTRLPVYCTAHAVGRAKEQRLRESAPPQSDLKRGGTDTQLQRNIPMLLIWILRSLILKGF